MSTKPLITVTIVERANYARRVAQIACKNQRDDVMTHDPKLAGEIAALLTQMGAEVRLVREEPFKP